MLHFIFDNAIVNTCIMNIKRILGVLCYFVLSFLSGFIIGGIIVKLVGVGVSQGLAAGAIAVFYALVRGFLGLLIAIFVKVKRKDISLVKANLFLLLLIVLGVILLVVTPKRHIVTAENPKNEVSKAGFLFDEINYKNQPEDVLNPPTLALGMFAPNLNIDKPFYFYGAVTFGKPAYEHSPLDSIVFYNNPYNNLDIKTAPPWLVPEHLKIDYGFLSFKALTITDEFIEIEVNKQTGQTFWVSRYDGNLQYWPEFLLGVNSVELIDPKQALKVAPLDHASEYQGNYTFLRPQKIKAEWMEVELLDTHFKTLGKAWVKWLDCGIIKVSYNLLS